MNLTQLLELFDKFATEQKEVIEKKNRDYAIDSDVFHNFKSSANIARIKPEQGCLNQISIKATRLGALMQSGETQNEPIEDTIRDLFNYSFLLYALMSEGEKKNQIPIKSTYIRTPWGFDTPWPEEHQIQAVDLDRHTDYYSTGYPPYEAFPAGVIMIVGREDNRVFVRQQNNSVVYLGKLITK
jgi:hypothetical protein